MTTSDYVNKNKDSLIRLDGRKYNGSTDRIVLGALYALLSGSY